MGLVYGVGINDGKYPTRINGVRTKQYSKWRLLLTRCFNEDYKKIHPAYKDCSMSENFRNYSYFYEWCEQNSVSKDFDYQLDKDLLLKGNKIYSEDNCVLIPVEINNALLKRKSLRGDCPIGVTRFRGKFAAQIGSGNKRFNLGVFDNPIDAFLAYKNEKEKALKELAERYRNIIDPRAYQALMNYSVDITD